MVSSLPCCSTSLLTDAFNDDDDVDAVTSSRGQNKCSTESIDRNRSDTTLRATDLIEPLKRPFVYLVALISMSESTLSWMLVKGHCKNTPAREPPPADTSSLEAFRRNFGGR
eukprot:TRINITY_DN35064_c0_g1_i1.p1 TRINITY_DN35064_c0_g1~~TRINITY_DN35064_c0_g1_i1.p1  ORF type:complete len:112 (+),score=4.83 TRINITY_DN35064_c0_g1_i1:3-338(+)